MIGLKDRVSSSSPNSPRSIEHVICDACKDQLNMHAFTWNAVWWLVSVSDELVPCSSGKRITCPGVGMQPAQDDCRSLPPFTVTVPMVLCWKMFNNQLLCGRGGSRWEEEKPWFTVLLISMVQIFPQRSMSSHLYEINEEVRKRLPSYQKSLLTRTTPSAGMMVWLSGEITARIPSLYVCLALYNLFPSSYNKKNQVQVSWLSHQGG